MSFVCQNWTRTCNKYKNEDNRKVFEEFQFSNTRKDMKQVGQVEIKIGCFLEEKYTLDIIIVQKKINDDDYLNMHEFCVNTSSSTF